MEHSPEDPVTEDRAIKWLSSWDDDAQSLKDFREAYYPPFIVIF